MKNIIFKKEHLALGVFLLLTLFLLSVTSCNQPVVTKPTDNLCTLKFNANGGSGTMDSITGALGSETRLPKCTFTKDGGFFHGWTTTPDGGKVAGDEANWTFKEKETTLYAIYTIPGVEYVTVTFHAPGLTDMIPQQKIEKDKETPLAANSFKNPGYEFKGWSITETSSTVTYTDNQSPFLPTCICMLFGKKKSLLSRQQVSVVFFPLTPTAVRAPWTRLQVYRTDKK